MITAAGTMKPLPIRPIDGIVATAPPLPLPRPASGRWMQPLPATSPEAPDMADAIRAAAFQRMLERLGVKQPLPVTDPTA